jgi:hypothetical protein
MGLPEALERTRYRACDQTFDNRKTPPRTHVRRRGSIGRTAPVDYLGAVDKSIHFRLENWGRVVSGRTGPRRDVCATAEVCALIARLAGYNVVDADRLAEFEARADSFDGWLVERAWRSPLMPRREKRMLRAWYVLGLPPKLVANAGRVPMGEVTPRMLASTAMIRARIDKLENRIYNASRQFDAPQSRSSLPRVTPGLRFPQAGASAKVLGTAA